MFTEEAPEIVPALVPLSTDTTRDAVAEPHEPVTVYSIVAIPAATPVTTPPLTVATVASEVVHTPPDIPSVSVVEDPTHVVPTPRIESTVAEEALTVTVVVTSQPPAVYPIVTMPVCTPVTTPVEAPTVA